MNKPGYPKLIKSEIPKAHQRVKSLTWWVQWTQRCLNERSPLLDLEQQNGWRSKKEEVLAEDRTVVSAPWRGSCLFSTHHSSQEEREWLPGTEGRNCPNGMAENWSVSQEWGQRRWGKTKDNINLPLEITLKDWEDGSVGNNDCSMNTRTCVLIHSTYVKRWAWLHIPEHQHWESRKGGHPVQWDTLSQGNEAERNRERQLASGFGLCMCTHRNTYSHTHLHTTHALTHPSLPPNMRDTHAALTEKL